MNMQQMFDTAYLGLMAQGRPARIGAMACAYRVDELKCGVGFLIKDEFYNSKGEEGVSEINPKDGEDQRYPGAKALFKMLIKSGVDCTDKNTHRLLCDIQEAHDGASLASSNFRKEISEDFQEIAEKFNLKMPEVPACQDQS